MSALFPLASDVIATRGNATSEPSGKFAGPLNTALVRCPGMDAVVADNTPLLAARLGQAETVSPLFTPAGAPVIASYADPADAIRVIGRLTEYARWRAERHPKSGDDSRFFLGKRGAPISLNTLEHAFQRLREHAEVCRAKDARYQPRLHDLRHTFAVHRLTEWYRQGADVQRLLHHLSVYLGHAHLAATQVYLTMTPELLHEAGTRFERYALGEGGHA